MVGAGKRSLMFTALVLQQLGGGLWPKRINPYSFDFLGDLKNALAFARSFLLQT